MLIIALLLAGCSEPLSPTYSPSNLRNENAWGAHPDDLEDLPFEYQWLSDDTESTYMAVVLGIPEETQYLLTINDAVFFDDTPSYWSNALTVRSVINSSITFATGSGSTANTRCTAPNQALADCPGFNGYFNATSQEGGRLKPGIVAITSATYGATAASILMTASFAVDVQVLGVYSGETRLVPIEADIKDDKAFFEVEFILEKGAYIGTRTYRTPYEGPVTIEHPEGSVRFEQSSFGWIADDGLYMEHRPHVVSGPGEYRISAQAGPPDGKKPALLLVGVMLEPEFFRHFEND